MTFVRGPDVYTAHISQAIENGMKIRSPPPPPLSLMSGKFENLADILSQRKER